MANLKLIRIDSRLIHGQVITKWLKLSGASRIVIVDDELEADPFMSDIFVMAAPQGISVEIYSVERALQRWKDDEMGSGDVLLLFKGVDACYRAFVGGFPIRTLQIGGLASAPGRTTVSKAVSFDAEDVRQLKEMRSRQVDIYIHIIPEESKIEFDKAVKNF